MKVNNYIFLIDGSEYREMYQCMLADVDRREDVSQVIDEKKTSLTKKILLKRKAVSLLKGKLDFLAFEKNALYREIESTYKADSITVVIFFNAALHYNSYLVGTLKKYKKKWPNLRYIVLYTDIMNVPVSKNADYLRSKGIFDLVYTIENKDALETNSILWRTLYSRKEEYTHIEPKSDIYFCGVAKRRELTISQVFNEALRNNISISADIICEQDTNAEMLSGFDNGIKLHNSFITYDSILKKELKSNCLLEIIQPGQEALTLRAYEAVVYGRKLLTNCKGIFDFPYYDDRYMHYFDHVKDIDWNWVKGRNEIEYHYEDSFSPIALINDIETRLKEV